MAVGGARVLMHVSVVYKGLAEGPRAKVLPR